jgi:hypothetical protein
MGVFTFSNPMFPAILGNAKAEAYRQRVVADGGVVPAISAVAAAYSAADSAGLNATQAHWTSSRFGYKLDANGHVIKLFCLFGFDAVILDSAKPWLLTSPSAAGKAAPFDTGGGIMSFQPWAYPSVTITVHTVASSTSWTSSSGGYNFFPLVEGSPNLNNFDGYLLAAETGNGIEGGYSRPSTVAGGTAYPSLNTLHALLLTVDATLPAPSSRRVWVDGVENTRPILTGTPTATVYSPQRVYIGGRGSEAGYHWNGAINAVFVSSQLLPASLLAFLNNQVNAY